MTVYADVLFALNAAVNYALLCASARLGGGLLRRWRLAAAGALGGVYAVAALLPRLAFLQTASMRMVMLVLMLLCAFGARRRTLRLGILFLGLCCCFAGLTLVAVHVLGGTLFLTQTGAYYPVSGAMLLLLAAMAYLVCELVFSQLAEHGGGELIELTLSVNARTVRLCALHDTGNTLRDPITNARVLVAEWEAVEPLFPQTGLARLAAQQPEAALPILARAYPALAPRLIPYCAVGTQAGVLLAFRCMARERGGKERRILVALSPTAVSDGGNYHALTGGVS